MMAAILQKVLTPIGKTLCSLHGCSILKLDELWSFVGQQGNPIWIWMALER